MRCAGGRRGELKTRCPLQLLPRLLSAPSWPEHDSKSGMARNVKRLAVGAKDVAAGCTFIDCELVYDGQPVQLLDNTFADCHWSFEGAAGITLDFLMALCRDQPEIRSMLARELGLFHDRIEPDRAKTH